MKRLAFMSIALLVVFFWSVPSSEAQVEPEWTTTFDFGGEYDQVSTMIIDHFDNPIVTGFRHISNGDNTADLDASLVKFTTDGSLEWTFNNEFQENNTASLSVLAEVDNQLFWVYATFTDNSDTEWWLSRRNDLGQTTWTEPLGSVNTKITSYESSILAIQEGTSSSEPARAIIFDTSGARIDSMILVDKMWAFLATPTVCGDYLWISFSYPEWNQTNTSSAVVKYDLINREVVWRWNLSDGIRPFSTVDSEGNTYFVCSRVVNTDEGYMQFVAAKLDSDGNEIWRTEWFGRDTYETNYENWVNAIDMSEYWDAVIVGGSIQRGNVHAADRSAFIVNLNMETGVIVWENVWDWDPDAVINRVDACRFDNSENLYLTGGTHSDMGNVAYLRKYPHRLLEAPEIGGSGPKTFSFSQNYPNPFNATTRIVFTIPVTSEVELGVYSLLGREVARLAAGRYEAGTHTISFTPDGLPSGMYFYRLHAGDITRTKTMILVK